MRPVKQPEEELSREEAAKVLLWLVDEKKKPQPKGGRLYLLHRTPQEVAKEYQVSVADLLKASGRKLPQPT